MDKDGLAKYYDLYSRAAYRAAYVYLANKQDSEDVLHDVFIELFNTPRVFADENHIKAWLIRAAINRSKNLLKRNRRPLPLPVADFIDAPDSRSEVFAALSRLAPAARAAVTLFYYDGYSTEEIAGIMQKSPGAIRVILTRARAELRLTLE